MRVSKTVFGFGLTSFFNDFSHEMTTALLPTFMSQLVGPVQAPFFLGLVTGISNFVSSVIRLWAGWLNDRIIYRKTLLIIGYTLTPLFSGLIGTSYTITQVVAYRTIAWSGRALREPIRDAWLTDITQNRYYGFAFGFVRALDSLGAVMGPLIVFFALSYFSVRTIFLLAFVPGFFSVLSLILLTKENISHKIKNQYNCAESTLNKLPLSFKYFLFVMFVFGIGNFNKTLLLLRGQDLFATSSYSSLWILLLYALFNALRAVSEFCMGIVSDYVDKKNLLLWAGFGFFAIVAASLLYTSGSLWLWFFIFLLAAISTGTITTVEKAYAAELLPCNLRGTGFGILQMADGFADLISSSIVGWLWSSFSAYSAFSYALITSVIAILLLLLSPIISAEKYKEY